MKNFREDRPKSVAVLKKEFGQTCTIPGCNNRLTNMQGPGSGTLCREHQLSQIKYGGMGRIDRKHTFHRDWVCEECGYNPLEDPRLADIEDEEVKQRVGRTVMHADHNVIPKADGGDDSKRNCRCLCIVCHAKKTVLNKDYLKRKGTRKYKKAA